MRDLVSTYRRTLSLMWSRLNRFFSDQSMERVEGSVFAHDEHCMMFCLYIALIVERVVKHTEASNETVMKG